MRRVLSIPIVLLIVTLSGIVSAHAQDAMPVELDEIVSISLNHDGQATISVNVPRTGVLAPNLFSDTSAYGEIAFEYAARPPETENENDRNTPFHLRIVEAGEHEIHLRSTYAPLDPTDVQIRLTLEPALDNYEPNDTLASATEITLPFTGLINLDDGGEDWFKISASEGSIVGAHLMPRNPHQGYFVSFYDAQGTELFRSDDESWGYQGMRYFASDGGELFVQVVDTYGYSDREDPVYSLLEIDAYLPDRFNPNAFVKIAMGADTGASLQIDFVGEASGTRVTDAKEAVDITQELIRTVQERTRDLAYWYTLFSAILAAIAFALIGYMFVKKRGRNT